MKASYFFMLLLILVLPIKANADLLVMPTRLVFEPRERTDEVTLINTGTETRTYMLEWLEQKQTREVSYRLMPNNELENFDSASPYIRFSPRRVRLAPGESQRVKLLLRRKAKMDAPEYRSHLKFTAMPPEDDAPIANEQVTSEGMSIKIDVRTSYTIPVVINNSKEKLSLNFSNMKFINKATKNYKAVVEFTLEKNTPKSAYGDMTLYFKAQGSDEYVPVGYLNGVNIFHESTEIASNVAWSENVALESGSLKLVYKGIKEFKDKFEVQSEINI